MHSAPAADWAQFAPPPRLITESAGRHDARLDIVGRLVGRRLRHVQAGVDRRPQGHDLHHGHAQVGVAHAGLIAPAPFGILRGHDQVDRLLHAAAHFQAADAAVGFDQRQRGQRVLVHRALRRPVRGIEPLLVLRREDVIRRPGRPMS